MSLFNLIDQKWIPVRFLDGRRDELGIRETLLRSKEIGEVEDASPLVVAALHRFLLTVLYRALEGPTDIEQAKALFGQGLPGEKLVAYLERWRDKFWLFDDKYPFSQIPHFEPKTWRSWTVLAAEHNADNAKVLFDHVDVNASGVISAAAATRWLLATQTFSVSAGKSELAHTGTAPSATAAMVIPVGLDLHDTLLFSLVPQNREIAARDSALWEREPESLEALRKGIERSVSGLCELYTWRTRSVRFKSPDPDWVAEVAFASGVAADLGDLIDPMLAYRMDEKRGRLPIQFRDRGLWRDFDALLPDDAQYAPRVIEHGKILGRLDQRRRPRSVLVLGQANNKAKIEFWRMERFALPEALGGDRYIRSDIRSLLSDAEDAQASLWRACRSYARDLLSRGEREPAAGDVRNFIDQMPVIGAYWSALEANFHRVLAEYTVENDWEEIRRGWLMTLSTVLRDVWDKHLVSTGNGDAWTMRAIVRSEVFVRRKLKELRDEIRRPDIPEEFT